MNAQQRPPGAPRPPLDPPGGALGSEAITVENFRQHPLFTPSVERLRPSEPLRPPAASPGLAIGAPSKFNLLGRGASGMVLRGVASSPPSVCGAGEAGGGDGGRDGVGQPVAVKMVHMFIDPATYGLDEAHGPEWDHTVASLMQELNAVVQFQHSHLIRINCFGLQTVLGVELPGYIALNLCTDGTLTDWIKNGLLGGTDVARFTQHLVDALHYLHNLRIVHRDIKPDNIFVDRRRRSADDGRDTLMLVVGDLGSAKAVRYSMTHATGGAFTPAYLAPEVGVTEVCTFESDVYAAGCVVVEMLTRTSVFGAEEAARTAAAAPLVGQNQRADVVATAKRAAAAAARLACADKAVRVATTHIVVESDDCWFTPAMVGRLAEAVAQERFERCTFAELFALGGPQREQATTRALARLHSRAHAQRASDADVRILRVFACGRECARAKATERKRVRT
jgi:serine/threonine protein kinase